MYTRRYNAKKTFAYNKKHGPFEAVRNRNNAIKKTHGKYGIETDFFGFKTMLPLGVAAGPLFSPAYMEAAAKDGFEVLTWKSFRSVAREAHTDITDDYVGHNIVPLDPAQLTTTQEPVIVEKKMPEDPTKVSITNSFGLPSEEPTVWMQEVRDFGPVAARYGKEVITAIVATPKEGGNIYSLAQDYAFLARAAEVAGAQIIEINLSCPNVQSAEGSVFHSPVQSRIVLERVRGSLFNKETKVLVKIGYTTKGKYQALLRSIGKHIDGVVVVNAIPVPLIQHNGSQAMPGGKVGGVCGAKILDMSVEAVARTVAARKALGLQKQVKIIGCGGVTTPEAFMRHIDAGAEFVMCATAALYNPVLPLQLAKYIAKNKIRRKI